MKGLKNLLKFTALGAAAGSVAASGSAQAGMRKPAAREGMVTGAVVGAAAVAIPKIVFRKIRGKIIPIRSK
jgi:hypothetical protein